MNDNQKTTRSATCWRTGAAEPRPTLTVRALRPLALVGFSVALKLVALDARATLAGQPGGSVAFTASGPGGLKIVGTTKEVAVSDDGLNIVVAVTLTHLTTGIELRDRHMRDKYLDVSAYPTAVLTVPRASLTVPPPGATQSGDPQGTLTLHGQTKRNAFHYSARNDGGTLRVDGTVHLDMRDYRINVPSYLGLSVKPDVDVDIHFSANDR